MKNSYISILSVCALLASCSSLAKGSEEQHAIDQAVSPTLDRSPTATEVDPAFLFSISADELSTLDVLQEVAFFGGGGGYGFCVDTYEKPSIILDPKDQELMSPSVFIACGWQADQEVVGTIVYPDGRVLTQLITPTIYGNEVSHYANLTFRPEITDPPGIYLFRLEGRDGAVESNAFFNKPTSARMYLVTDDHLLLYGFYPNERIDLYYYQEIVGFPLKGKLTGWQVFKANDLGMLNVRIPELLGEYIAVGYSSGQVPLLRSKQFGGLEAKILGDIQDPETAPNDLPHEFDIPTDYRGNDYLQCSQDLLGKSRLQEMMTVQTVGSASIYANTRLTARIIDTIPTASSVRVTSGPYCAGNGIWWNTYLGGYILELYEETYFLEP